MLTLIVSVIVYVWRRTHADLAQLGERETEDLEVLGSIPRVGTFAFWNHAQIPVQSKKFCTQLQSYRNFVNEIH